MKVENKTKHFESMHIISTFTEKPKGNCENCSCESVSWLHLDCFSVEMHSILPIIVAVSVKSDTFYSLPDRDLVD